MQAGPRISAWGLILAGQQQGGGVASGFGDAPDAATGQVVGAEDARAVADGVLVQAVVLRADLAPVAGPVAREQMWRCGQARRAGVERATGGAQDAEPEQAGDGQRAAAPRAQTARDGGPAGDRGRDGDNRATVGLGMNGQAVEAGRAQQAGAMLVGERLGGESRDGGQGDNGHGASPPGGAPWAGTAGPAHGASVSRLEGDRAVEADAGADGDSAPGGRLLRASEGTMPLERVPVGPL